MNNYNYQDDTAELLLDAARSEDLSDKQILELKVVGQYERKIIDTLKQAGTHLLEGARGVGKSMLMKVAEGELDKEFSERRQLGVYVSFKASTLLEGVKVGERDAFQIWVNTKILQAVHEKLAKLDILAKSGQSDPYHRVFGIPSVSDTKDYLQEKIRLLQKLARTSDSHKAENELGTDFLDKALDTSFLIDTLSELIREYDLNRIIFLFDEAAHTFIPSQQEIFFDVFKLLHGGDVAAKAAVYPTVTSYGRNFEIGQDAIVIPLDRFEPGQSGRQLNRTLFRSMLELRIPQSNPLRKRLFERGELLDLCIDLSTGNPRAFLHLIQRASRQGQMSDRSVLLATQDFVDSELLPYHSNLTVRLPKYSKHVSVGLELLRQYIIPEIRLKNNRRETKSGYQSAFFTTQRDISPNLKLALDLLCYSGLLVRKGTVKIAERQTGTRYMVHLAALATERAFSEHRLQDAISKLSLTDYREFSSNDPEISRYVDDILHVSDHCSVCGHPIPPNAKFCSECGAKAQSKPIISGLLEEPISTLSMSDKIKNRVEAFFPRVGDIIQATKEDLMAIPYIGDVRSRMLKNAADEYISG